MMTRGVCPVNNPFTFAAESQCGGQVLRGSNFLALVARLIVVGAPASLFAVSAHAADTVTIDVAATVAERCGIAAGELPRTIPDLDEATTLRFEFRLDCNTPFRLGVSTANGALVLDGVRAIGGNDDGFSRRKDYSVALDMNTDGDAIRTEDCAASALVSIAGNCRFYGREPGEGMSSGRRTAIRRDGAIVVKWNAGAYDTPRRAAGTYRDTITVVVGVRS